MLSIHAVFYNENIILMKCRKIRLAYLASSGESLEKFRNTCLTLTI